MNDQQSYLTAEKFDELKKELDHLKTIRRKEVAESLEYARSLGDLSENAEYQEARDMQGAIEERIGHLEKVIKEAKIVAHDKKGDVVVLGSTATIQKDKDKDSHTYTIVGRDEINLARGYVSWVSPLAKALLGKQEGDHVTLQTPSGAQVLEIVAVRYEAVD